MFRFFCFFRIGYLLCGLLILFNQTICQLGPYQFTGNTFFEGAPSVGRKDASLTQQMMLNNAYQYLPLTPEEVILDHKPNQKNPLYDKEIAHFLVVNNKNPIVAPAHEASIYMLDTLMTDSHQSLISAQHINDAQGKEAEGIAGLIFGVSGLMQRHKLIFAAVKKHEDSFGKIGSGIALIRRRVQVEKGKKTVKNEETGNDETQEYTIQRPYLEILNGTSGKIENKAVALDHTTDAIAINGGCALVGTIIDMYWDPILERLFVALHIKTSADASNVQGARALFVCRVVAEAPHTEDEHKKEENNDTLEPVEQIKLVFDQIAPDEVFMENTHPLGAVGSNKAVSLHKVRTLYTSTNLPYLIVIGGHGESTQTKRMVYAFPLVSKNVSSTRKQLMENQQHGTLADIQAEPKEFAIQYSYPRQLQTRSIETVLNRHISSNTIHLAMQVGAGNELPGDIINIHIQKDAISVVVEDVGSGTSGIFHSQAILDGLGKIASWTPWQRVLTFDDIKAFMIDPTDGTASVLCANDQAKRFLFKTNWNALSIHQPDETENAFRQVQDDRNQGEETLSSEHTEESEQAEFELSIEQTDLAALLNGEFSQKDGGIKQLVDIPAAYPGCGNGCVSCLIATGCQKVVLVETGAQQLGSFIPYVDQFTKQVVHASQGTLSHFSSTEPINQVPRTISFSGGVLDELGMINTAAITTDGKYSWLVVGGTYGIAVLAAPDGTGWLHAQGLQPGFASLHDHLSFKKVGNFSHVQKLMGDGTNLYILTNNTLERLSLSAHGIRENKISSSCLIHRSKATGAFYEAAASGSFALLGTSRGLFRTDNFSDIRYAQNPDEVDWETITLPEAQGPVHSFYCVTPNGLENGFAHKGQVYVAVGFNRTNVYRLFVDTTSEDDVHCTSVSLVPDKYFVDTYTPFIAFSGYRNIFATDGILHMSASPRQVKKAPFIELSQYQGKSLYTRGRRRKLVPVTLEHATVVNAMIRNSATGSWLVGTDVGLFTNDNANILLIYKKYEELVKRVQQKGMSNDVD